MTSIQYNSTWKIISRISTSGTSNCYFCIYSIPSTGTSTFKKSDVAKPVVLHATLIFTEFEFQFELLIPFGWQYIVIAFLDGVLGVIIKLELFIVVAPDTVKVPVQETLPLSTVKTSAIVSGFVVDWIFLIQNLASASSSWKSNANLYNY